MTVALLKSNYDQAIPAGDCVDGRCDLRHHDRPSRRGQGRAGVHDVLRLVGGRQLVRLEAEPGRNHHRELERG